MSKSSSMNFIVLLMFWTLDVVASSNYARVCKTPSNYVDATISVDYGSGFNGECDTFFGNAGEFNGVPWSTATCASFSTAAQKDLLAKTTDCCSDGINTCETKPSNECDSTVEYSCDGCGSDGMCNTCNIIGKGTDYEYEQMVDAAKTGCTKFKAAIGEKCTSDSGCVSSTCVSAGSSWTGSAPQIKRCCNADVDYSCDGCGSDGKCNTCSGSSSEVLSDGTGCSSGSNGGYGGGGGGMYGYGSETGVIAGGLVGMVILILIGVGVGVALSKKTQPPAAKMCLCCNRDAALVANIVTLSVMLIMFLICLSQTIIGIMISLSAAMSAANGAITSGVHMLYVTVPVLCGCAEVVCALAALGMNRLKFSACAKVLFSFAIIFGLGLIGISIFMLIYIGMYYMAIGMPGYGLYLFLGIFTTIILLVFTGIEACGCCCCCKRPDAQFDNAENIVQNPIPVVVTVTGTVLEMK